MRFLFALSSGTALIATILWLRSKSQSRPTTHLVGSTLVSKPPKFMFVGFPWTIPLGIIWRSWAIRGFIAICLYVCQARWNVRCPKISRSSASSAIILAWIISTFAEDAKLCSAHIFTQLGHCGEMDAMGWRGGSDQRQCWRFYGHTEGQATPPVPCVLVAGATSTIGFGHPESPSKGQARYRIAPISSWLGFTWLTCDVFH